MRLFIISDGFKKLIDAPENITVEQLKRDLCFDMSYKLLFNSEVFNDFLNL